MQTDLIAATTRSADARGGSARRGPAADGDPCFAEVVSAGAAQPAATRTAQTPDDDRDEPAGTIWPVGSCPPAAQPDTAAIEDETAAPGQAASPAAAAVASAVAAAASEPIDNAPAPPLAAKPPADAVAADDAATPSSAQATELAKVLDAGTRIQVTRTASGPAAILPPLTGASVALLATAAGQPAVPAGEGTSAPSGSGGKAADAFVRHGGSPALAKADALAADTAPELAGDETRRDRQPAKPGSDGDKRTAGTAHGSLPLAGGATAAPASVNPPPPSATATEKASSVAVAAGADAKSQATTSEAAGARPGAVQTADGPPTGAPLPPHTPASPGAALAGPHRVAAGDAAPTAQAGHVAVHISKAVQAGLDRIEIQLSPASLGRIEVRLDIADRQHVSASLSAETPDALDLLRAESRLLERALQDAGLKTDTGSLSFHLRDHGARSGHDGGAHPGFGARSNASAIAAAEAEPALPPPLPPSRRAVGGIDIRA
jgi:flagellar hook-length control protein FliK